MERSLVIKKTLHDKLIYDLIIFVPLFYSYNINHPSTPIDYIISILIFFKIYTL
jgi:hypothetical protein